jgi:hypothetical protein
MNLNDLFTEEKVRLDPKCWTGKKIGNPKTKMKGGVRVNNCVPAESVEEDLSRRGFLKGAGAAAVAGAAGGAMDAKAQDKLKIAVEVGELDTGTKEYDSVSSGQARNFVYLYDSSQFVMQWIDSRGNKISEPEVFQAKGTFPDFKNRPTTMYIGTKNAVKVVPNGSPEGDMIYFTPRNWIDQKIGWRSVYYQMFSKVKESVEQGVAEGEQRVDSIVTDALKIMRGSELSDAVQALKTVLGDREYNSRRGHYNFYVRQILDMYGQQGMAEDQLDEKSTSQAQFRTMAAAAHNPEFAKKVGISRDVAKEFHGADRKQDYTDLPKKADESKSAPKEKEADYGDDYQAMVARVKKLAGMGPLKTVYDPARRVYRNVPTAVQPKK